MSRPRLLDLGCCRGGGAWGYWLAGFDVIGVDIEPQPLYPFPMVVGDMTNPPVDLRAFDAIHASPPCQRYSTSTASTGNPEAHPDLIPPVRELLESSGLPYVIENVEGAPLRRDLVLCGSMFGLQVRRHRVFELGHWIAWGAPPCQHRRQGRTVDVTGHAGGPNQTDRPGFPIKYHDADHARDVMRMPWSDARGCTEAIPPSYTEWIGARLLEHLERERAA